MKILLLTHVPKIGSKGDVVEVSDGYAKNALFPKKLAIVATPHILHEYEQKRQKELTRKEERKEMIKKIIPEIQKHIFEFKIKAGKNGEVFTSLHQEEIKKILLQFLSTQSKIFEEEDIHLDIKPIKDLGDHEIQIRIGREDYIQKSYTHILITAEK